MRPRLPTWWAANSTSPWPRAGTSRSTPSAATAYSCLRCRSPLLEPKRGCLGQTGRPFFCPMSALFKLASATAMAALALAAGAQVDPAQMDAARAKAQVCAACHGPDGNSQNATYPILAGQTWRYIYIELKDFKEGRRSDPVMSPLAQNLSRDDMIALGNFFAAQKPLPIPFQADGAKVEAGRKTSDTAL